MQEPVVADLTSLDAAVAHLFTLIGDGVAAATQAFLASDRESVRLIVANEQIIDALYSDIEKLARHEVVTGGESAADRLSSLLLVFQVVPELERSGDLVEHIAVRAGRGLARPAVRRRAD